MSTTTALDLLAVADVQTRHLRGTDLAATAAQWESFDVTLHRLLLELTGADGAYVRSADPSRNTLTLAVRTYPKPLRPPPNTYLSTRQVAAYVGTSPATVFRRVHRGGLHAVKEDGGFRFASASIDDRPDIRPADPTDPHPLARVSCALGAMADLIRGSRDHGPAVLDRDGETAGAALHVLSLAAVAARHTLAHGPLDDAIRPVLVGRYAERVIDSLREVALHPVSLDRLRSVQPEPAPTSLNDRFEAALHTWQSSARAEIGRLIPSVDVLRQIANQGAHLCDVRAKLDPAAGKSSGQLRVTARALARGDKAWGRLTTLTRPSHEFVTASRDLYRALDAVKEAAEQPGLNLRRTSEDLDRGLAAVNDLMTRTRDLPDRLITANVLHGPARSMRATDDRLTERQRGRYVHARHSDVAGLVAAWAAAADSTFAQSRDFTRGPRNEMTL